jgi:outer membrane biosynthesis protein TonB
MSEANPLLSDKAMQGAAKAVEGLLDQGKINTKITSEPKKEVAKEEPKKTEDKTEENSKVQTEEKTEAQPVKEAEEEEASKKENAEETQVTDLHQIIVNGEKIDVDLDELKAGYQKDADYRRKTEELAIDKRQLVSDKDRLTKDYSTKMTDLNNLTATLNAEVNSELSSQELDKLFDEDPTEAAKLERKIRRLIKITKS